MVRPRIRGHDHDMNATNFQRLIGRWRMDAGDRGTPRPQSDQEAEIVARMERWAKHRWTPPDLHNSRPWMPCGREQDGRLSNKMTGRTFVLRKPLSVLGSHAAWRPAVSLVAGTTLVYIGTGYDAMTLRAEHEAAALDGPNVGLCVLWFDPEPAEMIGRPSLDDQREARQ
jgi:hypothetical protein